MYYEFFSNGTLVPLPESTSIPEGIYLDMEPKVCLFAPLNHILVGYASLSGCESWLWGKLHSSSWKEVQLYEEVPLELPLEGDASLSIPPKEVATLKRSLLGQLLPPGNHELALKMLRDTQREAPAFMIFDALEDEASLLGYIARDERLRAGYWGLRLASFLQDRFMLQRIETWLTTAYSAYDASFSRPRIWGFLRVPPEDLALEQLRNLGFHKDKVRTLLGTDKNPFFLTASSGKLVRYILPLFEYPDPSREEPPVTMALYFPNKVWSYFEEHHMELKDIVLSAWGFLDALDAQARFELFQKEDCFAESTFSSSLPE